MQVTSAAFKQSARRALADDDLQAALGQLTHGFPAKRREAAARLPEFDALRDHARDIKDHVLENLDAYLELYEAQVIENGGQVHWAATGQDACDVILGICRAAGVKTVTKSKTMIGEEIAVNKHLAENGVTPVETDLGEYIIQLRDEPPSHIIAPAIHLKQHQVAETFRDAHTDLDPARTLEDPRAMLDEAREKLRGRFIGADAGITGANMLIAETGANVIVTNEGNAELTYGLPRVHIVLASIEKIVPSLEDAAAVLRVLARSATGQEISVYTSFCSGPRRAGEPDGPEQYHVVLLDNGRSKMLGGEFQDMLRCIRCGACLNHCPVYSAVGGHAYGSPYSGPMGAVLTPALAGTEQAGRLAEASTLCGRCESVCPMRIPLPRMLRAWREKTAEGAHAKTGPGVWMLKAWAQLARRPRLYQRVFGFGVFVLGLAGRARGRFARLPFAGAWTAARDFPVPAGRTFMAEWKSRTRTRKGTGP
ncbi:MAG: lactate utilization protein B [Rhodospirillales bacterium]